MSYNLSVQTLIYRQDGTLFTDLGIMRWFGVNEDVKTWLAGSCKTTAFWLMRLPEVIEGESYTLKYRTLVTDSDTSEVVTDTTLLEFPGLSYDDITKFEYWALEQLREMIVLFKSQHGKTEYKETKRSILKTIFSLIKQYITNKRS
jgi:hypothetical protein